MPKSKSRRTKTPKRVLALPDLEQTKTAVLNSLTSASVQRTYDRPGSNVIASVPLERDEFGAWVPQWDRATGDTWRLE
jgi:hypothetical protein